MNNAGKCWQITFEPQETYPEDLNEFVEEYFDVVACNYTDGGEEQLVGYKSMDFNEKEFLDQSKIQKIKLPTYEKILLESENWLKDNVIKFAPVEVDDFLIYGIHEKTIPQTNKLAIKIYAATAFGSEHQTTKSCLNALSELNKIGTKHNNILDMGCGSGILSLACAKLWQNTTKITAVDIDEEAIWVTLQNARDNQLEDFIASEVSNGYNSQIVKDNAPYDIILSNILARPLIEMAPSLHESLKSGGYCILSGFVDEQEEWVIKAHQEQGLKLVKIYEIDNWRAALMEKA